MDNNQQMCKGCEGRLPTMAPLANPYVPFQMENPPTYDARMGFVRGTLYPGLDLPFMGMVNENTQPETMLTDLQTLGFAVHELALYLDTHRKDADALNMFRSYQDMYCKMRQAYEEKYGPLNHMTGTGKTYQWLSDPWPWEYAKNREV